ncbi:MAG: NAD(P)-dependent oxidoreductase [Pelagibacteraceae bacterium]|jgi:nucleoside-diphosphate-sugar epimerase|nr:NAD(P)-dependent oxidoreductase [Pelagibacteraceae bacterium]MBT6169343.1 NAD(P)-dependent oxidoreductase [Flavobacteriaceae bacterium]
MKNILITGGAGYVGSGLLRELLLKGYNVTCVDNLLFGEESLLDIQHNKNFTFYKCDINNSKKLDEIFLKNNFDGVIHLAAIVGDPACKLYSDLAIKTNLDSSKWLLERSKIAKVSKFIFASTCSNYGKMDDPEAYVDENSKLAPVSLYAELKVKFEKYMLSENQKIDGFFPTSLRFSTVYGLSPRMRFDLTVNEFTKDLVLGKELIIFGEQFWRPYCHVKDFSNAFITVLDSPNEKVAYKVFNVGDTKENYTKKMIVNEIVKILPNSKITYVIKNDDPRDYRVNCDKIKNELGFKISMTVPDGIREIKRVIEKNLIKDPENQKYYNTPHGQK